MGKNVEYTLDELVDAQDTNPEFRNQHQKDILTTFKRNKYWKNYHEEQEKNFTYAVQLPKPWDAIDIKRDPVHYTHEELLQARKIPENERTPRQNAILESLNNRRYYAYMRKHSPVPEWNQHIVRILTDIDNVEDILSTAGWAFFAAGVIVPILAPVLDAIGGMLEAATVPMNLVEAALGLTTGPMGAKRAFESLVRLTPMGRILKVGHVGLFKAMEKKLFSGGILRRLAMRSGEDIEKIAGKLTLKQRLKYALPNWGTALEAGQAAQTITGDGLILGPFFGAAGEMSFAGYRMIQGKKVKIYMPWEKPDLQTRIAMHAAPSVARLMMHSKNLTAGQQLKVIMVNAYVTQKLKDYWKDKDITPYIGAIAESDTNTYQEPASGSREAIESLGYKINPEDKSYLIGRAQTGPEEITQFEARTIQEEMQAILQKKSSAVKNIINTHKGYLSEQVVGNTINTAAEATASTVAGKDQEPNINLRADFKVALALLQHNILPFSFINYNCGLPGTAYGFSIDYTKKEVMHTLNIAAKDIRLWVAKSAAAASRYEYMMTLWPYFMKTQILPEDYIETYEGMEHVKLNRYIERPKRYYSWYFDIFDYWRKELQKLTRLYVKGQIKLTPHDILKHIAFPEPDLYDHDTGKTIHKKLNWVFDTQGYLQTKQERLTGIEPAYKVKKWMDEHKSATDKWITIADDLLETYLDPKKTGWELYTNKIITWEKHYNELLDHTFKTILRITGWEEIPSIYVFNPFVKDPEIEKKKKRLIGSQSPIWFSPCGLGAEGTSNGAAISGRPYSIKFYAYKKPPLFIMTPEEKDMAIQYGGSPAPWWNNTRLRNIYHKYLVTRAYDHKYKDTYVDLDTLAGWYEEMAGIGIELPNWPTKTAEKLKQAKRDYGPQRPRVIYTTPTTQAPTTQAPTTQAPTTQAPTTTEPTPTRTTPTPGETNITIEGNTYNLKQKEEATPQHSEWKTTIMPPGAD